MFLKLCKQKRVFYNPLDLTGIPAFKKCFFFTNCVHSTFPWNNPELQFCFLSKTHNSLTSFFFFDCFCFELYIAALPWSGGQRRYGWKPCTLWFCPLPNALAAGCGAAPGCAVGAPYEAVGWLGSAKVWPNAVRSWPYPGVDKRGRGEKRILMTRQWLGSSWTTLSIQ